MGSIESTTNAKPISIKYATHYSTWIFRGSSQYKNVNLMQNISIPLIKIIWSYVHVVIIRGKSIHNEVVCILGLYSLSGKTSYRKISWSLEVAGFGSKLFQSLWNLAGTSAALLPRCLSNCRAIQPMQHTISRLRDFTRFGGKTSYRLVNRGPEQDPWQCVRLNNRISRNPKDKSGASILVNDIISHDYLDSNGMNPFYLARSLDW